LEKVKKSARSSQAVIFQGENHQQSDELINQTYITQPALFIISYAQAQLLISWGIKPSYLMGHSVGEYVAATLSGGTVCGGSQSG